MAEKKSAHHDEFMELHMFKEEYIAKLEAIGIESPKDLAAALEDVEKTKEIHEHLKGAGPKSIEHWKEDLKVRAEPKAEKEEKPAPKIRKVKTTPKKASEEKETKKEEKEPEEPAKKKGKGEKEEEEVEIEDEDGYQVKLKPKLSKETIDALRKRAEVDSRRPEFLRQEWHRRKRLQTAKWRRPRGGHSKMRQHYGYRSPVVSIGYGSPRGGRVLAPTRVREVKGHNQKELAKIKPEQEAARVAHSVGMRKRLEIEEKADELKIRVLNRSG